MLSCCVWLCGGVATTSPFLLLTLLKTPTCRAVVWCTHVGVCVYFADRSLLPALKFPGVCDPYDVSDSFPVWAIMWLTSKAHGSGNRRGKGELRAETVRRTTVVSLRVVADVLTSFLAVSEELNVYRQLEVTIGRVNQELRGWVKLALLAIACCCFWVWTGRNVHV